MLAASKKRSTPTSGLEDNEEPMLFLRVQRRGAITAASTLRVDLDAASAAAAALAHVNLGGGCETSSSTMATTALFRRVVSDDPRQHPQDDNNNTNSSSSRKTKRRRILDAVLLIEDNNAADDINADVQHQLNSSSNKRRKLTLQLIEPKKSDLQRTNDASQKIQEYRVLSPEQRAVDDSLQQVFAGVQSSRQHCDKFLSNCSAFATTTTGEDPWWPWTWCHSCSGNWLHAAAIWNEGEVAAEYLGLLQQRFSSLQQQQWQQLLASLFQATDEQGQTPRVVAQLSGHEAVRHVLESFLFADNGLQQERSCIDDDAYDLYCLVADGGEQKEEEGVGEEHLVLDCELQDGCMGYWDDRGELVLEPPSAATGGGNDENNASQNGNDENDEDSNDEDYKGNDYPDDDDDDDDDNDGWSCSSNASYGCQLDNDFRRRPANFIHGSQQAYDENSSDDNNYDPAYGGVYGQGELLEYDDEC